MATNGNPAFLCQKANLIDADNVRMHPVLAKQKPTSWSKRAAVSPRMGRLDTPCCNVSLKLKMLSGTRYHFGEHRAEAPCGPRDPACDRWTSDDARPWHR